MDRRRFVRSALVAGIGAGASGCLHAGSGTSEAGSDTDGEEGPPVVEAGPSGDGFAFVPEAITVDVGETVTWVARSARHNVVCDPDAASGCELPDGAEPFTSYEDGESRFTPIPQGESYEYTFETPGEYVYVCVPHLQQDMVGRVTVVG